MSKKVSISPSESANNKIKTSEVIGDLKKDNKEKIINNQKTNIEIASLYRSQENAILNKYKENLPQFLSDRQEQIKQDVIALAEKVKSDDLKTNLEPVIMQIISKPFRGLGAEPMYTTREIAIMFEYYQDMVTEMTLNNIKFIPSRQNFCAFIGINSGTFDISYLNSKDLEKNALCHRIEDYFIEVNWSGAKNNKLNSYAVEKYNKIRGIGGGYVEPKVTLDFKQSSITIDSPEGMQSKLEDFKKSLFTNEQ